MTQRPRFIRAASACLLPHTKWDVDQAVRYAEKLWHRLSERGFGDAKTKGPQKHKNWIKQLSPVQKQQFDQFWKAYSHKIGKQNAAMRWGQLDPGETLTGHIVAGAEIERQRAQNDPAKVRKHAQGWLTERRWEDHEAPAKDKQENQNREKMQQLQAETAGLKKLLKMNSSPALRDQLIALELQIEELK